MANHYWPDRFGGGFVGVDIFFVISGFLITGSLFAEVTRTGRVRLARFWGRRARRLLPASLLTLLVSAGLVALVIPQSQWVLAYKNIVGSALYVINWTLISDSTNYFASADSPSLVTHYWSLAVEEQFYVVWPFLILLGAVLAGAYRRIGRWWYVGIIAVVSALSLVQSILVSESSPAFGYFATTTRAWEFGVGAIIAIVAQGGLSNPRARMAASWSGWIVIAASLLLIDEHMVFPGWLAAMPVAGAALVIMGREPAGSWSLAPLAEWGPVQFLGDISYSLYLWHWPLLLAARAAVGGRLSTWQAVALMAVTVGIAYLSKRFIEDPVRSNERLKSGPQWRTFAATAVAMAMVVGISLIPIGTVRERIAAVAPQVAALSDVEPCIGAAAVAPESDCDPGRVLRFTDQLFKNSPGWGLPYLPQANVKECFQAPPGTSIVTCEFGVPEERARLSVALVGDSHAGEWLPALRRIADRRDWHLTTYLRGVCPVTDAVGIGSPWNIRDRFACATWSGDVSDRIADDPDLDLVITSSAARAYLAFDDDGTVDPRVDLTEAFASVMDRWVDAGKSVFVIGATPFLPTSGLGDIPTCVASAPSVVDPCTAVAADALVPDQSLRAVERLDDERLGYFDPIPFLCDARLCHSVVGGVLAYEDDDHLSEPFIGTVEPFLDAGLQEFLLRR